MLWIINALMERNRENDKFNNEHCSLQSIVQELVSGEEKRKSAGPTAGEYRELIKANLKTASKYHIPVIRYQGQPQDTW